MCLLCVGAHVLLCGGQDGFCVYNVCVYIPRVEVRITCVSTVCVGEACHTVWRSGSLCVVCTVCVWEHVSCCGGQEGCVMSTMCVRTHAMLCGDQRVVCGAGSLSHLRMGCTDGT